MSSIKSWQNVGQNIRYLRKSNQLTLKQLASGCGLSANAISLIERGKVAPTVETLCKIAYALGVPAGSFFQKVCPPEVILTRAQGGTIAGPDERASEVLTTELLPGNHLSEPEIDDLLQEVDSITAGSATQSSVCVCGQIEVETNGRTFRLGPGDNISFNSNAQHRWRNPSNTTAIAVVVLSPTPH